MMWRKLGRIVIPDPKIEWMSHYAGPSFVEVAHDNLVVYVTGRDTENRSRIGRVFGRISANKFIIDHIEHQPVFDLGEPGCFDENGVSYPWIVNVGARKFMYYVGWVKGGNTGFQNFTGLAISEDGGASFRRASRVPILDRTDKEPVGSGSCAVFERNGRYEMLYTAFEPWTISGGTPRPCYNIKRAVSDDALHWTRNGEVIVDFASEAEYVIGKPMLLHDAQGYHLWYSKRGAAYRIGYAFSPDGDVYGRRDDRVGIDVSDSGWDSEMIEYAYVFDYCGQRYMVYNGNSFGMTGLGLAVAEAGS